MARRRYQKGCLLLRGRKTRVWILRWREDQVEADGSIKRVERKTVLGTLNELPTKKLARRRADLVVAEVNRPDYRPGKAATFTEFAERWRVQALALMKPSTVKVAESHLRCHLLPHLGRLRLEQIAQEDAQVLVCRLAKRSSRHTILNVLGTLFSILKAARKWGYTVGECRQSDLVIPSEKPSKPGRFFTAEQAANILRQAQEPWRTIFAVAAMTGLRPGEVLGLSVDDLDFESRLLFIRRSAWYSQLLTPKSKRSVGVVPMPAPLQEILVAWLQRWTPNEKRLLFPNRRGNPFSENKVVQKRLWPILDALGIPRCGMHAFRHTHASMLLAIGASPVVTQHQLRHADPLTTLRNYAHILGNEQRDAAERVAEILSNLRPFAAKSGTKSLAVN